MEQESAAMQLIVSAGSAKSLAMKAVACAKRMEFDLAEEHLKESKALMTEAHKAQTDVLQESMEDEQAAITMLMAHAQDHLMNAMTVLDMSAEFVALYQFVHSACGDAAKGR